MLGLPGSHVKHHHGLVGQHKYLRPLRVPQTTCQNFFQDVNMVISLTFLHPVLCYEGSHGIVLINWSNLFFYDWFWSYCFHMQDQEICLAQHMLLVLSPSSHPDKGSKVAYIHLVNTLGAKANNNRKECHSGDVKAEQLPVSQMCKCIFPDLRSRSLLLVHYSHYIWYT